MKLNKRVLTALLYILIAIVPIIALFAFSLSSYLKAVKEDNAAAIMQTLKQAAIYVTNEMEAARSLSDAMLVNKDINNALMDDPSTQTMDEQIEELTKLMNVMTTIKQSAYSFRIRLYVQDSKFYSNQRINFFPMSDFSSVPLEGAATPGGSYSAPYEMKYIDQDYPKIVVSHARILRNIHRFGEFIGATVIDLNVAEYLGLLQEMDFPEKYAVYFVDANGTKIISLNSMELGEISPIDLKRANAAGETIYTANGVIFVSKRIDPSSWHIVAELPVNSMQFHALQVNVLFLMEITLVFLGIFALVSLIIVDGATKRFRQIGSALSQVKGGIVTHGTKFTVNIFKGLDDSLENARIIISALYEQMEKQKRTQLQLMQEQIKPHFLYNALDSIQWMIRSDEKDRAGSTVSALTRYLRQILNNGKDIVTVSNEVDLAKAYLDIQLQRFETKDSQPFEVEFIVEANTKDCLIPKLTLQPIIENSVIHGLQRLSGRRGRIDVDIYAENSVLVISVTDNGVGIPAEKLETILSGTCSYGLKNVNQRVLLFSGSSACGLSFESEEGKYTTCTIRIAERKE